MNTARYIHGESQDATVGKDALGSVKFRTQTAGEQQWRDAMKPREGHKLVYRDVDATSFEIAVVPEKEAATTTKDDGQPTPHSLSREDFEVQAAQLGVPVKATDRAGDIALKVSKARETVRK